LLKTAKHIVENTLLTLSEDDDDPMPNVWRIRKKTSGRPANLVGISLQFNKIAD